MNDSDHDIRKMNTANTIAWVIVNRYIEGISKSNRYSPEEILLISVNTLIKVRDSIYLSLPMDRQQLFDIQERETPIVEEKLREFKKPKNDLEAYILDLFCGTVGLSSDLVSVTDNFFDLGGHSLVALQVLHEIYDKYNITVPVRALFEHPTPQELSSWIIDNYTEVEIKNDPAST